MDASASNKRLISELDEIVGWGTVAAPFVVALAFFPLNYDFFGLPKLTALYLGTLFLLYFQGRRWLAAGRVEIPLSPVLVPVVALLAVTAVTVAVSEVPLASIAGRFNRYMTLPGQLCFALVLWFALAGAGNRRVFTERFETVFTVVVFAISAYGLLETVGLDVLGLTSAAEPRVSSTLGNPVFFGGFLAMTLPFFLAKAVMFAGKPASPVMRREVAAGLTLFALAMLFVTMSRGAWLGTAAGFGLVVYYWMRGRRGPKRTAVIVVALLVVAFLAGTGIFVTLSGAGVDSVVTMARSANSLESRVEIWKTSLAMIGDRPLFGFGLDQTKDWFSLYMTKGLAELENKLHGRAHNIFLQMSLDGGFALLLAHLWLFLYALLAGARHLRRQPDDYVVIGLLGALVGFLGQGVTGIATVEQSVAAWFMIGAIIALTSEGAQRGITFRVAGRKPLIAASTACAALFALAVLAPLVIEARYLVAVEEAKASLSDTALKRARVAGEYLLVQPYYQSLLTRLHLEFAFEREDIAYARRAVRIAERGLEYAPGASELRLSLGSAHLAVAELGRDRADIMRADRYLRRTRKETPYLLAIRENLLELSLLEGDLDGALKEADFIDTLDRGSVLSRVARSVVLEAQGDAAAARSAYRQALALNPNATTIKEELAGLLPETGEIKKSHR